MTEFIPKLEISNLNINDTSLDNNYILNVSELSTDITITLPALTVNDTFLFESNSQTLNNKTFVDNTTIFQDDIDSTKQMKFQLSSVSTGSLRILTIPDSDIELVGIDNIQTLTNKTISAASNTITGLTNTDVGLGNVANTLNNTTTVGPTTTNDNTEGYTIGSRWWDTTNDKEYVCLDTTTNTAVWIETSGGGSGGINWLGAWNSGTSYLVDDAVESGGSSYICILAHTNQVPPNVTYWDVFVASGSGEVNTGSNIGTGGLGVFFQKSGVNLEFYKLDVGSNKLSLTLNTTDSVLDFDIIEGNIDINNLLGAPTGTVVGDTDTQTLTNKTIDSSTNVVMASKLQNSAGAVTISASSAPSIGQALLATSTTTATWQTIAETGETNTASNVGTGGLGLFKQKIGVDLEFYKIDSDDTSVTITNNTTNGVIDLSVNDSVLDHNSLTNLAVGDVHTQYALLAGRTASQTIAGSTTSAGSLTLRGSTANNGTIQFGNTGTDMIYSEATRELELPGYLQLVDITAPANPLDGEGRLYKKTGNIGLFWRPDSAGDEKDLTGSDGAGGFLATFEASSVITTSTTSITYVTMDSMTVTPVSGTYAVIFSCSCRGDSPNSSLEFAIHKNGVEVTSSARIQNVDVINQMSNMVNNVSTQAIVVTNGTDVIDIRYKTTVGTFLVFKRSMIIFS